MAGVPPCVDLAAHGAQIETLKGLLRGDPALGALYEVHVPLGYGLTFWLGLPLAYAVNGAFAVKALLWLALQLYPLSVWAMLRAFGRSEAMVLWALPLAFNISYWYGLLPGLFAQPLMYFAIAAFARALEERAARRWLLWVNALGVATLLCHLVAFAALGVALVALALSARPWEARLLRLVQSSLGPALLSVPKVWSMANRAVVPGTLPATEYDAMSHLNWFFKNYRPEGRLAAAVPLAISAVLVGLALWRWHREPKGPAWMFFALGLLYLATPKTLSGIFLISVRLPVLAGAVSLALVDVAAVPRVLRVALSGLCLASLGETAVFHRRFAEATAGLEEMMAPPPPAWHGYTSIVGRTVLGSKQVYLDHLGNWWTARHGRGGHNFFADADHHPVRFRDGAWMPVDLWAEAPQATRLFEQILVYGEGPLPPSLQGWREVARAHAWRKLERTP